MKTSALRLLSLLTLGFALATAQAQDPGGVPQPRQRPAQGESQMIPRGDRELLTFEAPAEIERLDTMLAENTVAPARAGEFRMNYFRSALDGSVQPYGFFLPRDYRHDAKYPLLVQLHGIGPKNLAGRRTQWRGMGTKEWIDTNQPVIVAQPFGRGNTFYQGMGEQDVLEVIADVSRRYSVDPDRVFIMGHSMGGAGSWLVGLQHPDSFGSITPIDAAMGFRDAVEEPDVQPDWLTPQIATFRPQNYFPNARNVPVFLKNAGAGIQKTSTKFSDGVVAAGGFATVESFPGMPHHFAPQISYATFEAAAVHRPIVRAPREVKFFTTTLRYDRAYWVTLDRLERSPAETQVSAAYDDGVPKPPRRGQPPEEPRPPSLSVVTKNVDGLTLRLRDAGIPAGKVPPLAIDGTTLTLPADADTIHLVKTAGAWQLASAPASSGKRHGITGPIGDAFNGSFLAVYGDGDLPLARAELDAIRNPPSQLVIQAEFPLKSAARLTADDVANSNLILFGTPKTNPILARLAPKLPAALLAQAEQGNAVVFVHPNPENPNRYVVVWTGRVLSVPLTPKLEAGWMQPVNLLPDFLVARDGQVTSAGHFDRDWK